MPMAMEALTYLPLNSEFIAACTHLLDQGRLQSFFLRPDFSHNKKVIRWQKQLADGLREKKKRVQQVVVFRHNA